MRNIAILLFTLLMNIGFSQMKEASIIFNDSTSILGLGEIKNHKIYFKVDINDETSEWNYEMAKSLVFSGYGYAEKYQYIQLNEKSYPEIIEVAQEGNITLYREIKVSNSIVDIMAYNYLKTNYLESDVQYKYYAKRKNETFPTPILFNSKEKLLEYFSDCPVLKKKIIQKIFTKKNIEEMIEYYNNYCNDEQ
jgi:hypothetical protein